VTASATVGVNEYQTDWFWKLQACGSPGSVDVPLRSPLSLNGSEVTGSALAKRSLAGGDADAAGAPTNANTGSTNRNAAARRPTAVALRNRVSRFMSPPSSIQRPGGRSLRPLTAH
jgi:hypothetical protein